MAPMQITAMAVSHPAVSVWLKSEAGLVNSRRLTTRLNTMNASNPASTMAMAFSSDSNKAQPSAEDTDPPGTVETAG
jgi:hypothetical protein